MKTLFKPSDKHRYTITLTVCENTHLTEITSPTGDPIGFNVHEIIGVLESTKINIINSQFVTNAEFWNNMKARRAELKKYKKHNMATPNPAEKSGEGEKG